MLSLIIPDAHVPFHHKGAWRYLLEWTKEYKPERIVILGDFVDFHALTTHRQNAKWQDNLRKEVSAGRKELAALRKAAPKAEVSYIEGNHEDRWNRYLNGRVPALRLMGVTWERELGLADLDIKRPRRPVYVPCGQGQKVQIIHGHEGSLGCRKNSGDTVRAAVQKYGRNLHMGHVHKMALIHVNFGAKGEAFGVEGGHLVNTNAAGFDYIGHAPPAWSRGFCYYDSDEHEHPYPTFVRC